MSTRVGRLQVAAHESSILMPDVHRIYDQVATAFDKDRSRSLMERKYLREVTCRLGQGAHILDLGCGSGEPIARIFIEE